jgi:hypothetical protein
MRAIWISGLVIAMLSGCASNTERQVMQQNEKLADKFAPTRMVYKGNPFTGITVTQRWAGSTGTSVVENGDPVLREDVWASFRKACGYTRADLRETRIVRHDPQLAYEVWVFEDPEASPLLDDTLGMSLVLRRTPEQGGTDIRIKGDCRD